MHSSCARDTIGVDEVGLFDDWWWLDDVHAEDAALDEVREPDGCLVVEESFRRDGEDLCGEG